MSKQNKNSRNRAIAKQFSESRKRGSKGPSRTKTLHNKTKILKSFLGVSAKFLPRVKNYGL